VVGQPSFGQQQPDDRLAVGDLAPGDEIPGLAEGDAFNGHVALLRFQLLG
jgi:hypothetical protein